MHPSPLLNPPWHPASIVVIGNRRLAVNANEALAKGPDGTIIFESAASPTENTETDDFQIPYAYAPGEYVIVIDAQGGAWEVWARVGTSGGE